MTSVSLCIPVYRSAEFLPDLFERLRALEPKPAEILLLDDASPDQSATLISNFAKQPLPQLNLRLIRNTSNTGIAAAYNRLAQEARAEWVHILDADDYPVEVDFYARVATELTRSAMWWSRRLTAIPRCCVGAYRRSFGWLRGTRRAGGPCWDRLQPVLASSIVANGCWRSLSRIRRFPVRTSCTCCDCEVTTIAFSYAALMCSTTSTPLRPRRAKEAIANTAPASLSSAGSRGLRTCSI